MGILKASPTTGTSPGSGSHRERVDEDTHYPVGQTMDTFAAANGPGLLLLHGPAIS